MEKNEMTFSSIYLDKKWYNGKNTELGLRRPKDRY